MNTIHQAFIGLGANLGSPLEQCQKVLIEIRKIPDTQFVASSSFYKTEPLVWEGGERGGSVPWYVNAVCEVRTQLKPLEFLSQLRGIEEAMGRRRLPQWGLRRGRFQKWESRLIDLDLISYDDLVMESKDLILPHPEMQNRAFVLTPLAEIAPEWVHPVLKKSIKELIHDMKNRLRIEKI